MPVQSTARQSPASPPSLEGAQQAGMNPLFLPDILCQMFEESLRLQFGSLPKHLLGSRPNGGQRILARSPGVRHAPLFAHIVLPQILAHRVAGHARLDCTHGDGSAQAALPGELDELGSLDHNPKRHPPPRPGVNFDCRQWASFVAVRHRVGRSLWPMLAMAQNRLRDARIPPHFT